MGRRAATATPTSFLSFLNASLSRQPLPFGEIQVGLSLALAVHLTRVGRRADCREGVDSLAVGNGLVAVADGPTCLTGDTVTCLVSRGSEPGVPGVAVPRGGRPRPASWSVTAPP